MINWKKITAMGYFLFSAVVIHLFSIFDHEDMAGEGELKNVCIAFHALVYDDTRDVFAPVTAMLIFPFIFMAIKRRLHSTFHNATTAILILFWLWRFFIRFSYCL